MDRVLRDGTGCTDAQLAQQLGVTVASVKTRRQRIGLLRRPARRGWSWQEDETLRRCWGQMARVDIAHQLSRSVEVCDARARKLGLTRRYFKRTPEADARIRELHAQGLTDPEIADKLGAERHTIGDARKALGLPSNGDPRNPRMRQKISNGVKRQCERLGVPNMAHLRLKRWAERARELGWPDDLRPRHLQILHALYHVGPMTRRELADAIGMPWKGSRQSLSSNDPEGSYLAHLQARGLVISLGRIRKGNGRGRSTCVYSLPLHVQPQPQPSTPEARDAA